MFDKLSLVSIASACIVFAGCTAPGAENETETEVDGVASAEDALTSASLATLPSVATSLSVRANLVEHAGNENHVVSFSVETRAVARAATFSSLPARVAFGSFSSFGGYQVKDQREIVVSDAATVTATAKGFVVVAGAHTFTIEGGSVRFSGGDVLDATYPSTAAFPAEVTVGGSGASSALPIAFDAVRSAERIDTSGSWKGRIKRVGEGGPVELHCWQQSNGTQGTGCEVEVTGDIVGRRGDRLVVQGRITGATADAMWNALPGGAGVRGAQSGESTLACGASPAGRVCVARVVQK